MYHFEEINVSKIPTINLSQILVYKRTSVRLYIEHRKLGYILDKFPKYLSTFWFFFFNFQDNRNRTVFIENRKAGYILNFYFLRNGSLYEANFKI